MAQQLGFFGATETPRALVIADDDTGTITYTPGVFSLGESEALFARVRDEVAWRGERRMMYDREVEVPRLVASYAAGEAPAPLETIRARVEAATHEAYTSIGCNLYRDGRDSVAWHNDDIAVYGIGPAIALASFGATRRMLLRTKPVAPVRRSLQIDLEPGSVLLMRGASQSFWDHAIPKERRPLDPRISVALRRGSRD